MTDQASGRQTELDARRGQLSAVKQQLLEKRLQGQRVSARPTISPRPDQGPAPLAFAQQRLWFVDQLAPGTAAYHIPLAAYLRGRLDVSALDWAFQEMVRRHAALRTVFRISDGQVVQVAEPGLHVSLNLVSLEQFAGSAQRDELQRRARGEAEAPFHLAQGPLVRATLFRLSDEEHVLCLVIHHIISDMWSLRVLMQELQVLYGACLQGQPSPLPELPIQYADYAQWERQWLESDAWKSQLDYWKEQLKGAAPVLDLPADRPRPAVQNLRGSILPFSIPDPLTGAIRVLCRQERVTLFMLLLAALQALLYRYTGQEDIVVSTSVANRRLVELEPLIGCFINMLLMRTDLSGNPSFRKLLDRVRRVASAAYAHQELPFELIVDALQTEHDLSYTPFAQVMLVTHPAPFPLPQLDGLVAAPMAVDRGAAQFDLTLHVWEDGDRLEGFVEYSSDLFDAATIARMSDHFLTLLQGLVANPDEAVARAPLLTPTERDQVVVAWNRTRTIFPQTGTIHQLIEEQACKTPDAVALAFEDHYLTYRALERRADQLALYLQSRGVKPDDRVGVCMERSLELVVSLLGILKAGAAYVPLDPTHPAERLRFVAGDAGTTLVLTQTHLVDRLPGGGAEIVCLDGIEGLGSADGWTRPESRVAGENLAYVIYTSGSTGQPKGAMNTHAGIRNRLLWMQASYRLTASDRVLQKTPFSFDVSVWEFFWPLMTGATLVLARPEGHKDNTYLVQLVAEQKITTLHFVPSMLHLFLETDGLEACAGLKRIICSGEALAYDLQDRCLARLGAELHNLYGPTEAAVDVTAWRCERRPDRAVPIGRPIANIQVYLLDPHGQPVPVGVPGELYIGGIGLARGYLNRPDLTAEKFIPHPFASEPGERLYRTGDVARFLPDGNIEYLGRVDFQVKIRGVRVEPGEIEAALRLHPDIREAAVIPHGSAARDKRLIAYVVLRQGAAPALDEWRRFLKQRLPDHMIPAGFVVLEAMALNANGKLDRRALPAPEHARPALENAFVPARTQAEEILAGIWSKVLEIDRVGIHDNFFALGGDSIRSITVLAQAQARGLTISLQQLFQFPTIAELASRLATGEASLPVQTEPFSLISRQDRLKLPDQVEDAFPLTTLQAGLVFNSEMHPGTPLYHDIMSYRLRAPWDPQRFQTALQRHLIERHAILRTAYDLNRFDEPLQLVYREVEPALQIRDLRDLSPEQQDQALCAFLRDEKAFVFDWTRPALVRFFVHVLSDDVFQYTLSFHDSTLDGWSVNLLNAELFQAYLGLLAGKALPPASAPAVTYRDFASLEQAAIRSEECRDFWDTFLRDSTFTRLPRWPSAAPHPENMEIRYEPVSLSAEVSEGIKKLALSAAVPLKSVLLAAHLRVLEVLSGQTDIVTGLEHNGRLEAPEGERVLGLFLNTIPFRQRLAGGTWIELVQETFRTEQQLLPFRRYPMARLQWRQRGQPLFEAVFNYTHFHIVQDLLAMPNIELLQRGAVLETEYPFRAEFNRDLASDQVELILHYDLNVFPREQIQAIGGYYQQALSAMAGDPSARYEAVSLLPEGERRQLLVEWNKTEKEYPRDRCFHKVFEEQVRRTPDAIAARCGQDAISYRALNQRANRWARSLVRQGGHEDALVAVLAERGIDLLTAILAIFKAGAVYLPLDPRHPAGRIRELLQQSGSMVVLTSADKVPLVMKTMTADLWRQCRMLLMEGLDQCEEEDKDQPPLSSPERPAYVIFTSGSTGVPKGAVVEQRGMLNHLYAKILDLSLTEADVVAQTASQSFDISVWQFLAALLVGGCVDICREEVALDPSQLLQEISRVRITILEIVPSMLRALLEEIGLHGRAAPKASSLRWLVPTGEALPPELCRQWQSHYAHIPMLNAYGPTECSDDVTHYPIFQPPAAQMIHMPIGRPIANMQLYVLDAHLQPVPVGVEGELYIGGDGVGRGYLHDPLRTAQAFIPDPFSTRPGARLYKSGDLARWLPEGNLEFLGRIDYQVKVRGFRIELQEIESALGQHAGVREAIVMDRADPSGIRRLVAYVVAQAGQTLTPGDLRRWLAQKLPDYMVPAAFILLSAMPLTHTGKIDRKALPEPPSGRPELEAEFAAPQTEIERTIARIWREVLGLDQVGIRDNFFELGGNSLLVLRVQSKMNQALSRPVPLVEFFQHPTISSLAEHLGPVPPGPSVAQKATLRAERRRDWLSKRKSTEGK